MFVAEICALTGASAIINSIRSGRGSEAQRQLANAPLPGQSLSRGSIVDIQA